MPRLRHRIGFPSSSVSGSLSGLAALLLLLPLLLLPPLWLRLPLDDLHGVRDSSSPCRLDGGGLREPPESSSSRSRRDDLGGVREPSRSRRLDLGVTGREPSLLRSLEAPESQPDLGSWSSSRESRLRGRKLNSRRLLPCLSGLDSLPVGTGLVRDARGRDVLGIPSLAEFLAEEHEFLADRGEPGGDALGIEPFLARWALQLGPTRGAADGMLFLCRAGGASAMFAAGGSGATNPFSLLAPFFEEGLADRLSAPFDADRCFDGEWRDPPSPEKLRLRWVELLTPIYALALITPPQAFQN